jgi:chromosome segregation ATPase
MAAPESTVSVGARPSGSHEFEDSLHQSIEKFKRVRTNANKRARELQEERKVYLRRIEKNKKESQQRESTIEVIRNKENILYDQMVECKSKVEKDEEELTTLLKRVFDFGLSKKDRRDRVNSRF